jgi:hypothetical protein
MKTASWQPAKESEETAVKISICQLAENESASWLAAVASCLQTHIVGESWQYNRGYSVALKAVEI